MQERDAFGWHSAADRAYGVLREYIQIAGGSRQSVEESRVRPGAYRKNSRIGRGVFYSDRAGASRDRDAHEEKRGAVSKTEKKVFFERAFHKKDLSVIIHLKSCRSPQMKKISFAGSLTIINIKT